MKKLLLAAVVAGLMSTSAMAAWIEGPIETLSIKADESVLIKVGGTARFVDPAMSADGRKLFMAVILTAHASGTSIKINNIGCPTSNGYWCMFEQVVAP